MQTGSLPNLLRRAAEEPLREQLARSMAGNHPLNATPKELRNLKAAAGLVSSVIEEPRPVPAAHQIACRAR